MAVDTAHARVGHGLRWHQMMFLAMGVPGTVFTLFGYTLGATGTVAAILLWTLAGLVALVQNRLWIALATRFGLRNGGLAMFAAEGWNQRLPIVAPVAAMSYWLAWVVTPAVMARIAAAFIIEKWFPDLHFAFTLGPVSLHPGNCLAMAIVALFAIINLRGLDALARFATLSGISLLIPIGLCLAGPLLVPDWSLTTRLVQPLSGLDPAMKAQILLAWMFTVCASVYASEMTVTFAAEYRSARDMRLATMAIGLASILIFALVPLGLTGMIDPAAFATNPAGAFVHLFAKLTRFPFGTDIIVAILVANMCIAASGSIADSARGLAANAQQGFVPRLFERVNRRGMPSAAILFGLLIDIVLLATDASPVGMIATGTIGYMTATLLALSAFLIVKPHGESRKQRAWSAVVVLLILFNLCIFVVGVHSFPLTGFGGPREAAIGFSIVFSSVILFWLRRRRRDDLPEAMP